MPTPSLPMAWSTWVCWECRKGPSGSGHSCQSAAHRGPARSSRWLDAWTAGDRMTSSPIRVLCVDDHRLVRKGVARLIDLVPDMTVVAEASNGVEAVAQFR